MRVFHSENELTQTVLVIVYFHGESRRCAAAACAARRGAQNYGQAVLVIQQRPLTSALKRTTYLQVTDNIITRVHIYNSKKACRKSEKPPPNSNNYLKLVIRANVEKRVVKSKAQ